jgi:hypothetical protein
MSTAAMIVLVLALSGAARADRSAAMVSRGRLHCGIAAHARVCGWSWVGFERCLQNERKYIVFISSVSNSYLIMK